MERARRNSSTGTSTQGSSKMANLMVTGSMSGRMATVLKENSLRVRVKARESVKELQATSTRATTRTTCGMGTGSSASNQVSTSRANTAKTSSTKASTTPKQGSSSVPTPHQPPDHFSSSLLLTARLSENDCLQFHNIHLMTSNL